MHKISFLDVSAFSVVIPFILSLFLLKKRTRNYLPIIFVIWLGTLYEYTIDTIIFYNLYSQIYVNTYVILESLLIILQFHLWNIWRKSKLDFYLLIGLLIIFWFANNLFNNIIMHRTSFFIIVSSFLIVIKSIQQINITFYTEKKNLLSNAVFLFCCGFIIFFSYAIIVEIFNKTIGKTSNLFRYKVYNILVTVNLISNIIYACAFSLLLKKSKSEEKLEPLPSS